jgi:hypothetical protein
MLPWLHFVVGRSVIRTSSCPVVLPTRSLHVAAHCILAVGFLSWIYVSVSGSPSHKRWHISTQRNIPQVEYHNTECLIRSLPSVHVFSNRLRCAALSSEAQANRSPKPSLVHNNVAFSAPNCYETSGTLPGQLPRGLIPNPGLCRTWQFQLIWVGHGREKMGQVSLSHDPPNSVQNCAPTRVRKLI